MIKCFGYESIVLRVCVCVYNRYFVSVPIILTLNIE